MKILKKLLILLLTTIVLFTIFSFKSTTKAYTAIAWDRSLTSGKDIAYYIASGCEYTVSIPQAVQLLVTPSGMWNPLSLSKTTVQSHSKMDFFQIYNNAEYFNTSARTIIYRKTDSGYVSLKVQGGFTGPDTYDWIYGDIQLNDFVMSQYSSTDRNLTILHEMLHVYGLRDLYGNNSRILFEQKFLITNRIQELEAIYQSVKL